MYKRIALRITSWIGIITLLAGCADSTSGTNDFEVIPEKLIETSGPPGGVVNSIAVSPDGTYFAIVKNSRNTISNVSLLYHSSNNGESWEHAAVVSLHSEVYSATNHAAYILGRVDNTLHFYSTQSNSLELMSVPDESLRSVGFDADANLLVGTHNGLYRTAENGEQWVRIGFENKTVTNIAVHQTGEIAAVVLEPGNNHEVYTTENNGESWEKVAEGIPDVSSIVYHPNGSIFLSRYVFSSPDNRNPIVHLDNNTINYIELPEENIDIVTLAIDSEGVIYAGSRGADCVFVCSIPGGVYKSYDSGITWEKAGLQSSAISKLVIDPEKRLIAGIKDFRSDQAGDYGPAIGVASSADKGNSWKRMNNGINHSYSYILSASTDGNIFAVADQLLYRTSNNGQTWESVYDLDDNSDFPAVRQVTANASGDLYIVDNFNLYHSTDHGNTWQIRKSFEPDNNVIRLVVTGQGSLLGIRPNENNIVKSSNGGQSFSTVYSNNSEWIFPGLYSSPWNEEFLVKRSMISGKTFVMMSEDDGATWLSIAELGETNYQSAVIRGTDPGLLSIVALNSIYVLNRNSNDIWSVKTFDIPSEVGNARSGVFISNNVAYIITDDKLYRSTDSGESWEFISDEGYDFTSFLVDYDKNIYAGTVNNGVLKVVPE